MKSSFARILVIVSMTANMAAAIFLLRTWQTKHEAPPPAVSVASIVAGQGVVREHTPSREQTNVATQTHAAVATNAPLPNIWGRVESADYKTYVANLRAIGCPESAIRDIVMLDLFKSLGEQMSELSKKKELPFWQTQLTARTPSLTNEVRLAVEGFTSLSRELLGVEASRWLGDQVGWMGQIFGEGDDFEALEELVTELDFDQDMNWMDPERRRALTQMRADFTKRSDDLEKKMEDMSEGPQRDAIEKKIADLAMEQERAEQAFLTAAEKREMELRDDYELKTKLTGVAVSRGEFEQLHDLMQKSAESDAQPWYVDGTPEQAQAKRILGDARYAQFKRAADPKYGELAGYATSMNLPLETLNALDDIHRAYAASIRNGADINAARSASTQSLDALIGSDEKLKMYRESLLYTVLPAPAEYTLKLNDAIDDIATAHNTSAAVLLRANGVTSAAQLQPGQVIRIPQ